MNKLIDLTGQTFGNLTVLGRDSARASKCTYWLCQCTCGKIKSVRGQNLKSGNTCSCGCFNLKNVRKKKRNFKDITGQKFGMLTVIKYINSGKEGTEWLCKCECGASPILPASYIKKYQSCGCVMRQQRIKNVANNQKLVQHTGSSLNILRIEPNSNNKSTGVRGVSYVKTTGKFVAYISYRNKRYTLKRSTDINVCIKARQEAEKAIREDFLSWYENFRLKSNK